MPQFLSAEPRVALVNSFENPYDNAIAAAHTCYSSQGIITPGEVAKKPALRDRKVQIADYQRVL